MQRRWSLEDEEWSDWHWRLTKPTENNYWSTSHNYTRSRHKTQCAPPNGHLHSRQTGKVKTFSKWVPHDEKSTLTFWTVLSLSMQHLSISPPDCDIQKKGGLYTTTRTTSSMVRPRNSKVMSKAKLAPKGYGHSAIHYSFLNPEKIFMCKTCAQQINNIHQKLQHLQPALANRKPSFSPQ